MKNPEIPLKNIILSTILMPFFGLTSLLSLDREARKKQFKKLFGSSRKMVASDSTMKKVLSWLRRKIAIVFLLGFLKVFEKEGLSKRKLAEDGPLRRIGIVDGSFMGSQKYYKMRIFSFVTEIWLMFLRLRRGSSPLISASPRQNSVKQIISAGMLKTTCSSGYLTSQEPNIFSQIAETFEENVFGSMKVGR